MPKTEIETALETFFTMSAPAPDFVARLEAQLLAPAPASPATTDGRFPGPLARLRRVWTTGKRPLPPPRWAVAALLILLLLAASLAAIGPQRALAALQNWIGYVPGVGFVDLANSRLMAAPVAQTRSGVTLHVAQLIAGPEETVLLLDSAGLPPMTETGADTVDLLQAQLRLPDGAMLAGMESSLSYGRGRYTFPPLPDGIYRVTLLLERLPLVPAGAAPEDWELPLALRPADDEWTAEIFPQPYRPDAAVTHHGVTLRIVEVAQAADVTAIHAQVEWQDPAWHSFGLSGGRLLPFLRDDLGHIYQQTHENVGSVAVARVVEQIDPAPTSSPTLNTVTDTYAPISPAARELTLVVDAIDFDVPADAAFTVDLGPNPQIGDVFPLDVTLDVAGFPVYISAAQLLTVEEHYHPDRVERQTHLAFTLDRVAETDGRALRSLQVEADRFDGGSSGYAYDNDRLRLALMLHEGNAIPTGPVDVQVVGAGVWLLGPWEVSWTVPGTAAASVQPRTFRPDAAVTQDGVTVSVAEMTLTDRVTAVQFQVAVEDGGEIFPHAGLARDEATLTATDNRGQRYAPADWTVQWQPNASQLGAARDPNRVMFAPLDPLARRVTFHVPSVLVVVAETAVVDVAIPASVTWQPNANPTWPPRSQPWPVDIPLTIAGYELRFSQAWLQEINPGQTLLHLETEALPQPANGPWLRALHIDRVVGPAGTLPASAWTRGAAGLFVPADMVYEITSETPTASLPQPPRTYRAGLTIDLGDAAPVGAYRLEIGGASVQVAGQWQIPVALP